MPPPSEQWDEVYKLLSWWDSERVAKARVLVVGAGALGNEVLKNLALLNTGYTFITDFDRIEYGNLSRSVLFRPDDVGRLKSEVAAERVREINPNCRIDWHTGDIVYDLGLGFIRTFDVIIGCLDNRVARLYINRYAYRLGKTWINGGILNLSGVLDVFTPGVSCYECGLKPKEWTIIRQRLGCTDVAKRNANEARLPTTPISSSIIGAMQVQEAFKIIYKNEKASLAQKRYFYDGQSNESIFYPAYGLKRDCLSHETWAEIIEAEELNHQMSVADLLAALRQRFSATTVKVELEYDIVFQLYSEESRKSTDVLLPRFRIDDAVYRAHEFIVGESVRIPPEMTRYELNDHFPAPDATLHEVGIPPWQIIRVEADGRFYQVELSGDRGHYEHSANVTETKSESIEL